MIAPTSTERVPAAFQLPAGIAISVVCVLLCFGLLANSGWGEVRDVAIAVAIGLVVYAITQVARKKRDSTSADYAD